MTGTGGTTAGIGAQSDSSGCACGSAADRPAVIQGGRRALLDGRAASPPPERAVALSRPEGRLSPPKATGDVSAPAKELGCRPRTPPTTMTESIRPVTRVADVT